MKLPSKYTILESREQGKGCNSNEMFFFSVYNVLKTTYLFKFRNRFYFSIFGEIITRESLQDLRDAKELIESKSL